MPKSGRFLATMIQHCLHARTHYPCINSSLRPRFGRNAKIIHFIGPVKPWQHRYLREVDSVILSPGTYSSQNVAQDFIRRWWQVYCSAEQVCGSYSDTWEGEGRGYCCCTKECLLVCRSYSRERGVVTAASQKSAHLQKCPSLAVA